MNFLRMIFPRDVLFGEISKTGEGDRLEVTRRPHVPLTLPLSGHACGGVGECVGWIKPKELEIRIESLVLFLCKKLSIINIQIKHDYCQK